MLNVDSQSSLNNIVVQVIGELSNKGDPSRKFVQTFVLAEQPNGYFVLNDIFRYLNDYVDEIEEEQAQPAVEESTLEEVPQAENNHESVTDEQAAQTVDVKLEEVAEHEAEAPAPTINGTEPEAKEPEAEVETAPEPTKDEEPVLATEVPPEPEPTPTRSPPKVATPAPVEAPPAKKTWANLVGSKAPATPAPAPTSALPAQPKAQKAPQIPQVVTSQAPAEPIPSPASSGSGWQTADHSKKQNRPQQRIGEQHLAYVKNVTSKVDENLLRSTLEKYGNLKYFDVSRQKVKRSHLRSVSTNVLQNCAFVDFADAAGYQAAVAANPHLIGTEQVTVEERRPRPGAFGNQAYGRGPNPGRGRGGMQARQGTQGGGYQKDVNRAGYQPRGGRGGNITPKGRSQVEAV